MKLQLKRLVMKILIKKTSKKNPQEKHGTKNARVWKVIFMKLQLKRLVMMILIKKTKKKNL